MNSEMNETTSKKREADPNDVHDSDEEMEEDTEDNVLLSRRPVGEVDMEDSDDEDAEMENTNKTDQELHNLEFEFCDPTDDDFHYVKTLLGQGGCAGIPGLAAQFSDLADKVVNQKAVGTMIKVPETSDQLYSMATILGLNEHKSSAAIQALLSYLRNACPVPQREDFKQLISGTKGSVGWLLNERILNVPSQVAAPLHRCLLEDVAWVRENLEEAGAYKGQFDFEHILVVCPIVNEDTNATAASSTKRAKPQVERDYYKFEEEFFTNAAQLSFECKLSFPVAEGTGAVPQKNKPRRAIVSVLRYTDLARIVKNELANVELEF